MTIIDSGEIDVFVSGLKNNDFLLISGESLLGINEIMERAVINTANYEGRVAYFGPDNEPSLLSYVNRTHCIRKPENVTVFIPGSQKSGEIDVINHHSIEKIKTELEKQRKKNIIYDLVVIDCIDQTSDFIYDKKYMYSICRYLRNQLENYPAAIIATSYSIFETCPSFGGNGAEDKLFYDVRDVVDFLMLVDDDCDPDEEPIPSQINVRIIDCRTRQIDLSYLFSAEGHKMCRKEGKALELYKKAIAVGIEENDAASYATYWYDNEMEEDEDFEDMRFSQVDDDDSSGYYAVKEELC